MLSELLPAFLGYAQTVIPREVFLIVFNLMRHDRLFNALTFIRLSLDEVQYSLGYCSCKLLHFIFATPYCNPQSSLTLVCASQTSR